MKLRNKDKGVTNAKEKVMSALGINPDVKKVHRSINPEKRFEAWRNFTTEIRRRSRVDRMLMATSGVLVAATAYLTWELLETDFFSVLTSRYGWVTLPALVVNGLFLHWTFNRKHPDWLLPFVRVAFLNTVGILPLTQVAILTLRDIHAGGMVGEKIFPWFQPLLTSNDAVVVFQVASLLTSCLTFFSMSDVFTSGIRRMMDLSLSNADVFIPQAGATVAVNDSPTPKSTMPDDMGETFGDMGFQGVETVDVNDGPIFIEYLMRLPRGQKADPVAKESRNFANSLGTDKITFDTLVVGHPRCIKMLIPHSAETRAKNVHMFDFKTLFNHPTFRTHSKPLPILFGVDVRGNPVVSDMPTLTHMLIAGMTGGGKSKLVDVILLSMAMSTTPSELEMVVIDPKMVEMKAFERLPHLREPIISDMSRAMAAMGELVDEMEARYLSMAALADRTGKAVRNIEAYNAVARELNDYATFSLMPYVVGEVDEFADMMMNPSVDKNMLETFIARLAQKGRASGIHLILATQKPLVTVVTSIIKGNMPCKIALEVATASDSTVILDQVGAQLLLGRGDMYVSHKTFGGQLFRAQAAYIPDDDVPLEVAKLAAKYPRPDNWPNHRRPIVVNQAAA